MSSIGSRFQNKSGNALKHYIRVTIFTKISFIGGVTYLSLAIGFGAKPPDPNVESERNIMHVVPHKKTPQNHILVLNLLTPVSVTLISSTCSWIA